MAKFELNIYGENDEIIKKFTTDHIRYGVLVEALEIDEITKNKTPIERFKAGVGMIKRIFDGITDEEIMCADMNDVLNTYKQITAQVNGINSSDDPEKN